MIEYHLAQEAKELFDRSLNQYYLRARYYNQGVGRFTQQDTHQGYQTTPTTLNKYLYAGGNPVMHLDPSGRMFLAQFSASQQVMGILALSSSMAYVIGQELANDNTVGGGYSPLQLGWLTIAGLSQANSQIREKIGEQVKKRKNQEKVNLYRTVEDPKLASLYQCQCYGFGDGNYDGGKMFWLTEAHSISFGYQFTIKVMKQSHFHVTNATISKKLFETVPPDFIHPNLDAIGDAVTVPANMLPAFNVEMNANGGFKYLGTYWKE